MTISGVLMGQSFVPPAVPQGRKKRDQESNASLRPWVVPAKVAGDKGYRSQWIDEWLLGQNITPVIPSKENEDRARRAVEFDKDSYRRRCIIEQMIGWIKECRRVATRYEKLARNYLSMVKLSMIGRFLRLIAPWDSVV